MANDTIMARRRSLSLLFVVLSIHYHGCNGLTSCSLSSSAARSDHQRTRFDLASPSRRPAAFSERKDPACDPCQRFLDDENNETADDLDLDRREAIFSTLGSVWAAGLLPAAVIPAAFQPVAANAVYGAEPKIQLPSPIESLNDRATKQCLVESLGNRECLVYMGDADSLLYKGVDAQVLIERLQKATIALSTIPPLVDQKKWSQVSGVMTGPMGELIRTMGQLVDLDEKSNPDVAGGALRNQVKLVKTDLYAIAAAVDRKDGGLALKSHAAATDHLVSFVKSL